MNIDKVNIDEMPAGREMDILVAEVMGIHLPPLSDDISAAWGIVEHFQSKGYLFSLTLEGIIYSAWFALPERFTSNLYGSMPIPVGKATSAPLAICCAAYKAEGG